jgi:D-3-phosphoglycerate dehydrogenase
MAKTMFVTGGSRGIGAAVCRLAARDGYDVAIGYAGRADAAEAVAEEVRAQGRKATTIQVDVADEAALVAALQSGRIGAVGLDVFDDEPPTSTAPLSGFNQAVLTPHIAGLTRESAERMALASVQNVLDFFAGTLDPGLVVNRMAVYG